MDTGGTGEAPGGGEVLTRDFVLLSIASFLFMGSFYIVIPILPLYMVDVAGATTTQVGLLMGVLTISSMLVRPYIGKRSDRMGRKPLMLIGAADFVAVTLLYMVAHNLAALAVLLAFHGVGVACFHTASLTYVGDISPAAERGKSMSWFQASFNVAIMVAPLAGAFLRDRVGYDAVYGTAAVLAGASLVVLLFIAESKVRAVVRSVRPGRVAQRRLLAVACVAAFAGTVTLGAAESFLALFAQSKGIPHFAVFFTISAGTLILLRFAAGSLPDRIGRRLMITLALAVLGASMFVLAPAGSLLVLCIAALVHGVGFAYHAPTISALLADRVPAEELGAAFGIYTSAFEGGVAFGSIVMGPVAGALGYGWAFVIVGCICFAGSLLVGLGYGLADSAPAEAGAA